MTIQTGQLPRHKKYKTRQIGQEESEQIVRLNQGGYYLEEICEITGRTAEQIEGVLWNADLRPRTHRYDVAEVSKWVEMYTGAYDGMPMSFAEIQRQTGRSPGTIQLAILRAGVRDRHPSESRRLAHVRRMEKKEAEEQAKKDTAARTRKDAPTRTKKRK